MWQVTPHFPGSLSQTETVLRNLHGAERGLSGPETIRRHLFQWDKRRGSGETHSSRGPTFTDGVSAPLLHHVSRREVSRLLTPHCLYLIPPGQCQYCNHAPQQGRAPGVHGKTPCSPPDGKGARKGKSPVLCGDEYFQEHTQDHWVVMSTQ